MTDFVFIRHGETDWNVQQRFQGRIDVPLNATGRAQAAALAARLAAEPAPDLLVSSDLLRARETAAPLARAWGLTPVELPGLREQGFGILEGLDAPTVRTRHPDLWRQWLDHRSDFALPGGGESLRTFHDRVVATIETLAAGHPGQRIVAVTHGGVLDMLWRNAGRLSLDGRRDCAIPNTGVNRLRWQDGMLLVDHWGDDTHLETSGDSST